MQHGSYLVMIAAMAGGWPMLASVTQFQNQEDAAVPMKQLCALLVSQIKSTSYTVFIVIKHRTIEIEEHTPVLTKYLKKKTCENFF